MTSKKFVSTGIRIALLLAVVALLAAGCGPTPTPAPPTEKPAAVQPTTPAQPTTPPEPTTPPQPALAKEQVIRVAEWDWAHIDPGIGGGRGIEPVFNLFEGLMGVDYETGEIIPMEAEKWEVSDDGLIYTIYLREGMKWSDGTPLTAKDYEYAWKRNLDPATGSRFPQTLYPIKGAEAFNKGENTDPDSVGVKALDDLTLQVTLERPTGFFLSILTYQPTYPLPKWAIEKYGDQWSKSGESLVTNGPFMLEKWDHGVEAIGVPNPYYWGTKPTLQKIIWKTYEDPFGPAQLTAYENGELDEAYVPELELDRVRNDSVLSKELHRFPRSGTWFLLLDTAKEPFDNLQVRQALYLAIDRETLTQSILRGALAPAYTITPPSIPAGYNADARLPGGIEEAKKLLADAGYPDGQGFPEVTLTYESAALQKLMAEAIQGMWRENLGINIRLDPMERKAFLAWRRTETAEKPYDMYMYRWLSDYLDPANWANTLWDSDEDFFHTRWKNEKYDELVRQALAETDPAKRAELYQEAEVLLVHDAAVIPLTGMDQNYLVKPYVKGIIHHLIIGPTIFRNVQIMEH